MNNLKLFIVMPLIASYRKDLYDELAKSFNSVDIYSNKNINNGFKENVTGKFNSIHTPFFGSREKIYYQSGIITSIIKNKPDAIYLSADFRALHYYLILLVAKILNIPTFPHGQSLFNKPNPSLIHRLLFKTTIFLSSTYICYTRYAYQTLIDIGIKSEKLAIMDNTIVNEYPIQLNEKNSVLDKLLYIGRLRKGSNLKLLFDAMALLSNTYPNLILDIIGDGEEKTELEVYAKNLNLNINFLGAVYDDSLISNISKDSKVGIYPGDAGLSIVHYMSLSLVPIVHNDLANHMGPEPSYIVNKENGLHFIRNDKNSLANTIEFILNNDLKRKEISQKAFEFYKDLSSPSMASKLIKAINKFLPKEKL